MCTELHLILFCFLLLTSSESLLIDVLFWQCTELKKIQKEQPLQHPPKPPQKRKWRGSTVAPFAGNNMLILYSCPAPDKSTSKHFVQVLHNEHPVPLPVSLCTLILPMVMVWGVVGFHLLFKIILWCCSSITQFLCHRVQGCDGSDFCPFEVFKVLV